MNNNRTSQEIRQEIKFFHEKVIPVLKAILREFDKKTSPAKYANLIRPCQRLIQKCSCHSFLDINRLNELAYWLYIYGYKSHSLAICEISRNIDFTAEYGIGANPNVVGLEIRIARELFGDNRRHNLPAAMLDYCFTKSVSKRLKYPDILREEKIASCHTDNAISLELLYALYDMIGFGETGLYNQLNDNWPKIEECIIGYIDYLKAE